MDIILQSKWRQGPVALQLRQVLAPLSRVELCRRGQIDYWHLVQLKLRRGGPIRMALLLVSLLKI